MAGEVTYEVADAIVVVACSTGGPRCLQSIIPFVQDNLDGAVLIVQHMPSGFTHSMAVRLDELSVLKVKEAQTGDVLRKGWVYVAPGGRDIRVVRQGAYFRIVITDGPTDEMLKPSANVLFRSLASLPFKKIMCVVLTGMGSDGTEGIRFLKASRDAFVVVQNKTSSLIYGMPGSVHKAGLADLELPAEEIADAITQYMGVQ